MPAALRYVLRRLGRRPGTTAVHIGGLAVGLACCLLALLFVRDELSYDRFHPGADRIVVVQKEVQFGDVTSTFAQLPEGGRAVLEDLPGVEALASTDYPQGGLIRTDPGAEGVDVERVRFADAAFFEVFAFPLVHGDAQTALDGPGRVVLTASLAESVFGGTDVIGRTVTIERTGFGLQDDEPLDLLVTGVAADPPTATTLPFDAVVSGQTAVSSFEGQAPALNETSGTYLRLASAQDTVAVKAVLEPLREAESGAPFAALGFRTPRLVDAHLAGGTAGQLTGGRSFLVLFATVAALVLLLACVNYANLATALAVGRATEVGVRKTLGAERGHLVRLFLSEAVLLSAAAGVVAVGLVALVLPAFNAFFDKGVGLGGLGLGEWAVVPALALAAGLLAGAYPALVLARFRPAVALRGGVQGAGGTRVRRALVVFQFAVTAVLLAATAVVTQQMDSARTRDLGFEGDRVVALALDSERLRQGAETFEQRVEALPGVTRAALASSVPGDFSFQIRLSPGTTNADPSDDLSAAFIDADPDVLETLALTMAAGDWITEGADDRDEVVLNETAARQLGLMTTDPAEAVGGTVGWGNGDLTSTVVGIVRDFHFKGPRVEIEPLVVRGRGEITNQLALAVQLGSTDARTLGAIRTEWTHQFPEYPFDPQFVDDTFAEQLRADRRLGQLFGAFGLIAVVLACVGVFGLAAHAAEQRTKEIGIRKALGATVAGLVARLSREFAVLVVVALAVAGPVAVVLARRWLEGFAYPAPLTAGPFVAVGLGVLALALVAAGVHAVRAATADPVRALRSE